MLQRSVEQSAWWATE